MLKNGCNQLQQVNRHLKAALTCCILEVFFLPDLFPTKVNTCCYWWQISPLAYPDLQCGNLDLQTRIPHCERSRLMKKLLTSACTFPSHTDNTAVDAPAVARNGVLCRLTRGQGPRRQPDPRTAAAAGCSQNPPCAVRSFPCEPAGDSWGSRWCDQTPTCGHSPHLYSPVTLTGSKSK